MAGKNDAALQEKEAECQSTLALKEAGCKQRIALKEMSCEFAVSLKGEDCQSRLEAKDLELLALQSGSWSEWESSITSLLDSLDKRYQNVTSATQTWIEETLHEYFGATL